jgi:ornithine--oxo-acid transaminase
MPLLRTLGGWTRRGPQPTTTPALSAVRRSLSSAPPPSSSGRSQACPVVISRGSGSRVWDTADREYIDLSSCNAPLGHAHPGLTVAIAAQAATLGTALGLLPAFPCEEAARLVAEYFGYARAVFFDSHAGAADAARQTAHALAAAESPVVAYNMSIFLCAAMPPLSTDAPGAEPRMDAGCNGFGSRSLAAREARELLRQRIWPVQTIAFGDLDALENAVKVNVVCALEVEPVQIDAGVIIPRDAYIRKAVDICRRNNVLVIADERRTGFGRTGRPLFCDHAGGAKPDMVLLGSALTGGMMASSCLLLSESVSTRLDKFSLNRALAHVTSPLACSVALATVEAFRSNNLCENAEKIGAELRKRLGRRTGTRRVFNRGDIRGRGLLNGLVIGEPHEPLAQQVCLAMAQEGLLANCEQNVVFLTPALTMTENELSTAVSIIRNAVQGVLDSGAPEPLGAVKSESSPVRRARRSNTAGNKNARAQVV